MPFMLKMGLWVASVLVKLLLADKMKKLGHFP